MLGGPAGMCSEVAEGREEGNVIGAVPAQGLQPGGTGEL